VRYLYPSVSHIVSPFDVRLLGTRISSRTLRTSFTDELTNKTHLKEHPEFQTCAMNGLGDGYATLLNMAIPYLHSKLVVDGHHTSAPKQRAGDSISEYTVK
jgi:hypothetical protein